VNGGQPALNLENFGVLGVGVQNLMLAYHDLGENEDEEMENLAENNLDNVVLGNADNAVLAPPTGQENLDMMAGDNDQADMELFHFNDLVQTEVAHLQLGKVETFFFPVNDSDKEKFSPQGMALWNKFFAPHICDGVSADKVLNIPSNWFNFITLMLLTPEKFEWAKNFLSSPLWEHVSQDNEDNDSISFVIPDSCLVKKAPVCQIAEMEQNEPNLKGMGVKGVTPSAPKRKRRGNVPIVEQEVRRSPRLIVLNDGYKNHATCSDKNCLSCNSAPPVMKNRIVKNLATSFCKVSEENLDGKLKKSSKKDGKERNPEEVGVNPHKGKKKKSN
jgi:hypothetical protein